MSIALKTTLTLLLLGFFLPQHKRLPKISNKDKNSPPSPALRVDAS